MMYVRRSKKVIANNKMILEIVDNSIFAGILVTSIYLPIIF